MNQLFPLAATTVASLAMVPAASASSAPGFAQDWQAFTNSQQSGGVRAHVYRCNTDGSGYYRCRVRVTHDGRTAGCVEYVVDDDYDVWGSGHNLPCPSRR